MSSFVPEFDLLTANKRDFGLNSVLSARCTVRTVRHLEWWWKCWFLKTPTWRSSCRFHSGKTSGRSANAAWRTSNISSASWMRRSGSRNLPSVTRPPRRQVINSQRAESTTAPPIDAEASSPERQRLLEHDGLLRQFMDRWTEPPQQHSILRSNGLQRDKQCYLWGFLLKYFPWNIVETNYLKISQFTTQHCYFCSSAFNFYCLNILSCFLFDFTVRCLFFLFSKAFAQMRKKV